MSELYEKSLLKLELDKVLKCCLPVPEVRRARRLV